MRKFIATILAMTLGVFVLACDIEDSSSSESSSRGTSMSFSDENKIEALDHCNDRYPISSFGVSNSYYICLYDYCDDSWFGCGDINWRNVVPRLLAACAGESCDMSRWRSILGISGNL